MKYIVGIAFLVFLCDSVRGESCTNDTDCMATTCIPSTHVFCEHPPGSHEILADAGLCTCAVDTCLYPADCMLPNHPALMCQDDRRHCYDNRCICSRFDTTTVASTTN